MSDLDPGNRHVLHDRRSRPPQGKDARRLVGISPAIFVLLMSIPAMVVEEDWNGRPMIDERSHLWLIPAAIVVSAFLVGGILVGYRRSSQALLHAMVMATVASGVLLAGALVRRLWLVGNGLPMAVLKLWFLGALCAGVLGEVGALLGKAARRYQTTQLEAEVPPMKEPTALR